MNRKAIRKAIRWTNKQGETCLSIIADVPIDSQFLKDRDLVKEQIIDIVVPIILNGKPKYSAILHTSLAKHK